MGILYCWFLELNIDVSAYDILLKNTILLSLFVCYNIWKMGFFFVSVQSLEVGVGLGDQTPLVVGKRDGKSNGLSDLTAWLRP